MKIETRLGINGLLRKKWKDDGCSGNVEHIMGYKSTRECVLALEQYDEMKALVQHPWKRMGGVEADGADDGDYLVVEVLPNPARLGVAPFIPAQESYPGFRQRRQ